MLKIWNKSLKAEKYFKIFCKYIKLTSNCFKIKYRSNNILIFTNLSINIERN